MKVLVQVLEHAYRSLTAKDLKLQHGVIILLRKNAWRNIVLIKNTFVQRKHIIESWTRDFVISEILSAIILGSTSTLLMYSLHGPDVLKFDDSSGASPFGLVFPEVTKCTFRKRGPSGTFHHHDALCVMALNIATEKIYIFLWFWIAMFCVATLWRVL
jgi:hypothetical protein